MASYQLWAVRCVMVVPTHFDIRMTVTQLLSYETKLANIPADNEYVGIHLPHWIVLFPR